MSGETCPDDSTSKAAEVLSRCLDGSEEGARTLLTLLIKAFEQTAQLAEAQKQLTQQAKLNCVLVEQNAKLVERNRDLGDTAAPWSATGEEKP